MDVSGRKHSGLLTAEDMASWTSTYDEVASYNYGEYTVCKCGPWSQGPYYAAARYLGWHGHPIHGPTRR